MIGKVVRGDDPKGLMRYLLAPQKGLSPDHIDTRHIVNLDLAGDEMAAVIAGARHPNRIRNPIEHIIIAWRRDECPTIGQQKSAAWSLVRKLGLAKNQIVIAVHEEAKSGMIPGPEGRHYETHVAINRVRLDGTVAKLSHDYARVEVACAEIAAEMHFQKVPGRFNGGASSLARPGVGNTIGSIAAQTGRLTLAEEVRADGPAMEALRAGRAQGWLPLLSAFEAHGIVIEPGRERRRADLRRGLVMVDAADPGRRIKISALDAGTEKWSSTALERELGPMPDGWERVFSSSTPTPKVEARNESGPTRPGPGHNLGIADAIKADPHRMARLRAARARGWTALAEAFAAQGVTIGRGRNARRGIETGLVMIDSSDPSRSAALSALDTPTEKWGMGALTKELGPWPGSSRPGADIRGPTASKDPVRAAAASRPRFDRDETYREFLRAKADTLARNRVLATDHKARMEALIAGQRRERDRHYRLRSLRRSLVRSVFGRRSLTAQLLNAATDTIFEGRMRDLTHSQSAARRAATAAAAADRSPMPTWSAFLRSAQVAHAAAMGTLDREAAEAQHAHHRRAGMAAFSAAMERRADGADALPEPIRRHLVDIGSRPAVTHGRTVSRGRKPAGPEPSGETHVPAAPSVAGDRASDNQALQQPSASMLPRTNAEERQDPVPRSTPDEPQALPNTSTSGLPETEAPLDEERETVVPTAVTTPSPAVGGVSLPHSAKSPDHSEGVPRSGRDAERKLVIDYALVLVARDAWTEQRAALLAALIGTTTAYVWKSAHRACLERFGKARPEAVERTAVADLRRTVKQEAEAIGFRDLLRAMAIIANEKPGNSRLDNGTGIA